MYFENVYGAARCRLVRVEISFRMCYCVACCCLCVEILFFAGRQTDRRTDRRTDRQTDGQTDGQADLQSLSDVLHIAVFCYIFLHSLTTCVFMSSHS